MNETLFIALQRLAPKRGLSRAAGWLGNSQNPLVKKLFIRWFVQRFNVDMSEAQETDPYAYPSFNAFFTRALKPGARPICAAPSSIACPADGSISQIGAIEHGRVFQAKGQSFSVHELLGGDSARAADYAEGQFITVYLSPRDYHRVHMPLTGELVQMTHVPGDLFSVNTATAANVPRLFARNERVVCHFETPWGPMAVVLVGAIIVASIATPWAGLVTPIRHQVRNTLYGKNAQVALSKGEEMGRFLAGSTAIVLLPKGVAEWDPSLQAGSPVRMGQALGNMLI